MHICRALATIHFIIENVLAHCRSANADVNNPILLSAPVLLTPTAVTTRSRYGALSFFSRMRMMGFGTLPLPVAGGSRTTTRR